MYSIECKYAEKRSDPRDFFAQLRLETDIKGGIDTIIHDTRVLLAR